MDDHFDNLPSKEEFDQELWASVFRFVGEYVIAFQNIEYTLKECIISMLGCDESAGHIVCGELGFRGILNVFGSLSIETQSNLANNQDFTALRNRLQLISEKRNAIVHSTWIESSISVLAVTCYKSTNNKKGYCGCYLDEPLENMFKEISRIHQL